VLTNTRSSPAKPAALEAEAMKAVTGVGAPWYTSGVQTWKGTAATLNPRPTSSSAKPPSRSPSSVSTLVSRKPAMAPRLVDPVAP
jgi:hypothetical protein